MKTKEALKLVNYPKGFLRSASLELSRNVESLSEDQVINGHYFKHHAPYYFKLWDLLNREPSKKMRAKGLSVDPLRILPILKGELTKEERILALTTNGMSGKYITDLTEEERTIALKSNGCIVQYLPNVTPDERLLAVSVNPYLLADLPNPTAQERLVGIRTTPRVLKTIHLRLGKVTKEELDLYNSLQEFDCMFVTTADEL